MWFSNFPTWLCPTIPPSRYLFDVKPLVHPTENLVSAEMCKVGRHCWPYDSYIIGIIGMVFHGFPIDIIEFR